MFISVPPPYARVKRNERLLCLTVYDPIINSLERDIILWHNLAHYLQHAAYKRSYAVPRM